MVKALVEKTLTLTLSRVAASPEQLNSTVTRTTQFMIDPHVVFQNSDTISNFRSNELRDWLALAHILLEIVFVDSA